MCAACAQTHPASECAACAQTHPASECVAAVGVVVRAVKEVVVRMGDEERLVGAIDQGTGSSRFLVRRQSLLYAWLLSAAS